MSFLSGITCLIIVACTPAVMQAQEPERVLVNGRHVEIVRLGTGSPTIVLESGAGTDLRVWNDVIRDLAKQSHVIAYSRAGLGQSEASQHDSPAARVQELDELLRALGEAEPVVLVGWSYGGLLARLFVSTHPNHVAGLVLVEGTHESQFARWQPLFPQFRIVDEFSRLVLTMPDPERADLDQLLEIQRREHVPGMQPLPDIPLAVITGLKPCPPEREPICHDPRALSLKREFHGEWFERSSASIHIVSNSAGHMVMSDEPELVLQAVRHVLDTVRRGF